MGLTPLVSELGGFELAGAMTSNILSVLFFNIVLPTVDIVTDLLFICRLYLGIQGKYSYYVTYSTLATALLIPFLLNYFLCLIAFFRKAFERKFSSVTAMFIAAIFALLNLYPQFEAVKIICHLLKNPSVGKKKKKIFEQDIGLLEIFLESVPTVLIMTVVWLRVGYPVVDEGYFFFSTFSVSVISASLGLAKCLKNGVARPIGSGGILDGLLSTKYLLAYFACGTCFVAKGFCLGSVALGSNYENHSKYQLSVVATVLWLFGPQFLLAIYSTLNFYSKSSLKILARHPSLLLLPTVTFFTFSRIKICRDESRVIFSKKFTKINIGVSGVALVTWFTWFGAVWDDYFPNQVLAVVPSIAGLSVLLTGLFLQLDQLSPYCCDCFLSPGEQLSVYDPDLDQRFIMKDGEVVEDPEDDVEDSSDDVKPPGNCKETETMVEKEKKDVEIGEGN